MSKLGENHQKYRKTKKNLENPEKSRQKYGKTSRKP